MANDTIFALSSAPGRAAVAVVRISGPQAADVLSSMVGGNITHRAARLRIIRHPASGIILDRALVLFFQAPATETGEDIAEFQLHGSRAVVAAVLAALGTISGCRLALPGEFARRAFDNGKIDLTAAEGLADLIDAETEESRIQALAQASGVLEKLYSGWRQELIAAQALVEAAIDFSDEGDVGDQAFNQARARATSLAARLESHLAAANRGEILRSGFRVVLAGPPNAGKSSLLNALAKRDAAIVSAEPGTTRDVIEVRLDLEGIPVLVSDTAGIREATGDVEREGIRRTLERAGQADLVLWLQDATHPPPTIDPDFGDTATIPVATKIDLLSGAMVATNPLAISVRTGAGIDALIAVIVKRARQVIAAGDTVAPTQARHWAHLEAARRHLETFLEGAEIDLELRAEDVRLAANELGRLTGRIDPEDVLGEIFGRFCIGK
jgi:tRNA modification GTPase